MLRNGLTFIVLVSTLGCMQRAAAPAPNAPAPAPAESADQLTALGYLQDAAKVEAPVRLAASLAGQSPLEAMASSLKLIRTAQIAIEVRSYARAAAEVERLAASRGGYVAETRATRGDEGKQRGTLTIRVPAQSFDEIFSGLSALGEVRSESISTQDVTKAYADLETRLRVKRETASRLIELLRTRTGKLSDVLEAEQQIARVTEEIEQLEGERRFYDRQVALSTISLDLFEPAAIVTRGILAPIREAFQHSLAVLAESVAALVYLLVFLTPWLAVLAVAWRVLGALRRRRVA